MARMLRTLVCLAAAMTGTASLLACLDPTQPPPITELPATQVARLAQEAVTEAHPIRRELWRDVEVSTIALPSSSRPLLGATPNHEDECHFLVDDLGRTRTCSRWTEQRQTDSAPGTVRIAVSRRAAAGPGPSQWHAVRTLVGTLHEHLRTTMPVRMSQPLAAEWGLPVLP